jgi:hypothetical protein
MPAQNQTRIDVQSVYAFATPISRTTQEVLIEAINEALNKKAQDFHLGPSCIRDTTEPNYRPPLKIPVAYQMPSSP